jgi:transposase-like protein
MDETYVGGKIKNKHWKRKEFNTKQVVVGMKQRDGDLRLIHAPNAKIETLAEYLKEHVSADVKAVMTDELPAYPRALRMSGHDQVRHGRVNHSLSIYSYDDVTTNGIESAFSLFKRGIMGSFHHVSAKHLHRYLSEFDHRFNRRKMPARFNDLVTRSGQTSPLPYRTLVGK